MMDRKKQIKAIWGLARELKIERDDVYALLFQASGKDSMTDCTEQELSRTIQALILLKERRTNRPGMISGRQRYYIRQLTRELGWDDDPRRLRAFCKKYYHVDSLDWLTEKDASNLIESLKNLLKREKDRVEA